MKFIATTSDKMKDIQVVSGQLIFSRDDRVIYLDTDTRTSFQQILSISTEEARIKLAYPVSGFYFIENTKTLWEYKSGIWTQLTEPPKENLVFLAREDFPSIGKEEVLYIDKDAIYQWDSSIQDYIAMAGSMDLQWGIIK